MSDNTIRPRVWDMGDDEPEALIQVVSLYRPIAGRIYSRPLGGRWVSKSDGLLSPNLSWPELLRRFGPVAEVKG